MGLFRSAFGSCPGLRSPHHKARNQPVRRFFWLGGTSPLTRPKRQPLRACTQATGLVKQDGYLGFLIAGHGGGGSRACGAGGTCRVPTGGSTGSPKGGQGDGTSPPRGGRFGPLWGPFDQEEGGPAEPGEPPEKRDATPMQARRNYAASRLSPAALAGAVCRTSDLGHADRVGWYR